MYVTIPRNGSEQSYRYARSVDGRESWTPRASRSTFDPTKERTMNAKFAGTCRECGQRFPEGAEIVWSKANGSKHVACPPKIETAPAVAAQVETVDVDERADALLDEYDAIQRRRTVLARKAVYRVSLDGTQKRYGVSHVNVQMVPQPKYGSVKVSEYKGESVGVVKADGSFMYWSSVDRSDPRVQAIVHAMNVVLDSADPIQYAKAYAIESSTCYRCGETLVDDGNPGYPYLGPVCFKKDRAI